MEHTLIVAGIGPGDPDYILPKAQKAIEGAHYPKSVILFAVFFYLRYPV